MSLTLTLEQGGGEVSGSGTQIELEGTGEGYSLESVTMNGDTEQQTYSGKNLFNKDNATYIGGYFEISAGTIIASSSNRNRILYIPCEANTTYSLTKATGVWSGGSWSLGVCHETPAAGVSVYNAVSVGNSETYNGYTTDSSSTYLVLRCQNADATTYGWNVQVGDTGLTVWQTILAGLQFEKSSTATSYEPYVGGVASPNPDYPQEVQTVTGRQLVTLNKKNLFDKNNPNYFVGYFDDSRPKLTPQSGNANNYTFWIPCEPNTAYSLRLPYATSNPPIGGKRIGTTSTLPVAGTPVSGITPTINQQTQTYENYVTAPDAKYLVVRIQGTNFNTGGGVWELTLEKLQIERGTTATTYEEFQGQSYEVNLGKNLFDKDNVNAINGYLSSNGTIVASNSDRVWWVPCQPNTTYTVQRMDNATLSANRLQLATTAQTPVAGGTINDRVGLNNGTAGTVLSITTGANAKYLCMQVYNTSGSTTESAMIETVQVEKGPTATTYAPYFTPIELCKIGDYQDYIYKSGEDWYVHKAIGKVVLDGSSEGTWTYLSDAGHERFVVNYSDIALQSPYAADTPKIQYCQYFEGSNGYHTYTGDLDNIISGHHNNHQIIIRATKYTSLSAFTTWLSTTKPAVYYALATATDTQVTNSALIAQLDALSSAQTYDGTTYITVSSENLKGSLDVTSEAPIYKTYTEVEIGSPFTISDVEGKSSNTTLDGNVYVDWAYNKKQYSFDLFNLTPQDYADIRAYYDYQFSSSAFPTITVPELNIEKLPVYMEISSRNIINQCLLTDKLTIKFRETVQP